MTMAIAELPVKLVRVQDVRQRCDDQRIDPARRRLVPERPDACAQRGGRRVRHVWRRAAAPARRRVRAVCSSSASDGTGSCMAGATSGQSAPFQGV